MRIRSLLMGAIAAAIGVVSPALAADKARVVLVPGHASHGPGDHEFHAGLKLLGTCLKARTDVDPVYLEPDQMVSGEGWPRDESVFQGAKAIVFFMDGGGGHPAIQENRLKTLQKLADEGVGLVFMHYAVEVPKGEPGDRFLDWIGGYYETGYSTNPHWKADVKSLPKHPITNGVKPFAVKDEWYFSIRFRPEMRGVTPILVAAPDDETRKGVSASPRGPYSHIVANKGKPEVLAWAVERPDGGRGFGFTGGHAHANWGNDDFRKLVLNAVLWAARVDVPAQGVDSKITQEQLSQDLDPKKR